MPLMNFNKTVPFKRKYGIAGYFQLILHNFFDLVLLNILFIFTSLPIFTIGASYLALQQMTLNMYLDKPTYFCKEYFACFKKNFKDGVISGLIFTALLLLSGFAFFFYYDMAKNMPIMYLAAVISLICFILFFTMGIYYYPQLCLVKLKITQMLKNSLILCIAKLFRTLCAAAIGVLFVALFAVFFPYSIPFIVLGPISLFSLACSVATYKPIKENVMVDEVD